MPSNEAPPSDPAPEPAPEPAQSDLTLGDALQIAIRMHQSGNLEVAEKVYEAVLRADADHVDALHFQGLLRHQQGRLQEGMELVRRAVALAPDHADARNNLGNMLLEGELFDEAEEVYRQVLAMRPSHAGAHTNLGTVLRRKGELGEAEAAFRKAIELDPEHGEAYHNLGNVMRKAGRYEEALAAYGRALALRPYEATSYQRIGILLAVLGRMTEASEIYRRWMELQPDNPQPRHLYAACSGKDIPARASDDFVRSLFNGYAGSFDRSLIKNLSYRAPELVADAVGAALGAPAGALDVLDAGAGTGLCGPLVRPFARRLVGVDLSPNMLQKAKERGSYDALETAELTAYLAAQSRAFDLVISADTLVYFGDLGAVLAAAAGALRAGGHLVFTVEHAQPEPPSPGFLLAHHGRYLHGERYVEESLAAAGLTPISLRRAHLRTEFLKPVDGLVVTARL
jgi:predicted TPR repeat methyltransferase